MPADAATPNRAQATRCKRMKRNGERCKRSASSDGLCKVHAGLQDMKALGRAGGQARTRSVLAITDDVVDDRLRTKAKARLEALLDSEDEGKRLAAARALYSYGPTKPPNDPSR